MQFPFRFDEISRSVSNIEKQKMNGAMPAFLRHMSFCTTPTQIWDAAKRFMRRVFPLASPVELDILTAIFINQTFRKAFVSLFDDGYGNPSEYRRDSERDMGEADMLLMQQMLERKTLLEAMISNAMKMAHKNGQAAIIALKGS